MLTYADALAATLKQEFVRIRKEHEADREAVLLSLCTRTFHTRCIVFTREKRRAHRIRILFGLMGLKVEELHGNLTQVLVYDALSY
jgi:ATP-dependent RNA helicase DDX27